MTRLLGLSLALALFVAIPFVFTPSDPSSSSGGPARSPWGSGTQLHQEAASDDGSVRMSDTARGRGVLVNIDDTAAPISGSASSRPSAPRAILIGRGSPRTIETSRDPETLITLAAMEFGVDPAWMLRVAWCESRHDTEAVGDHGASLGLWQFQARTFIGYARLSGLGYTLIDVADPLAQSRLAAWAFANGRSKAWTCAREGGVTP